MSYSKKKIGGAPVWATRRIEEATYLAALTELTVMVSPLATPVTETC